MENRETSQERCPHCDALPKDSGHNRGLWDDGSPFPDELCEYEWVGLSYMAYQRRMSIGEMRIEHEAAR